MSEKFPDDKTLLGFLLGSLPDEEMEQVRQAIVDDPSIAVRLGELNRELLEPLRADQDIFEPSAGLVDRVLRQVDRETPSVRNALSVETAKPSGVEARSWRDMFATIAATIVVASLLMPSLLESREFARRASCSENMRYLASSIASFADISSRRRIPAIDLDGPYAFAGMYSVHLNDLGLLDRKNVVWCPSLTDNFQLFLVPTSAQLRQADAKTLSVWQKLAGGSYGYNLGVMVDGRYETPELQGRPYFAILADAPLVRGSRDIWLVHAGQGLNMLYEDGHISFVRIDEQFALPDHPFLNRDGHREAGVDPLDSVLGSSSHAPFYWSTQK